LAARHIHVKPPTLASVSVSLSNPCIKVIFYTIIETTNAKL